jgi:hypothetical protein
VFLSHSAFSDFGVCGAEEEKKREKKTVCIKISFFNTRLRKVNVHAIGGSG